MEKEVKKVTRQVKEKVKEIKKELEVKTYYDLEKNDILKYEKEFKETPGGHNINAISTGIAIAAFGVLLLALIIQVFLEIKNIDTSDYLGFLLPLYLVSIITALVDIWYYTKNFNGWLKNKHNIKRW